MNAKQFYRKSIGLKPEFAQSRVTYDIMEQFGQYKASQMFLKIYPTEDEYLSVVRNWQKYALIDDSTWNEWKEHKSIVDKWEK